VEKIRVKLRQNSYDVLIGSGLLSQAGRLLKPLLPGPKSKVFVVTSPTVRRHWGERLEAALRRAKLPFQVLEMNDGEPSKRIAPVEELAEQMVLGGADRKSLVLAFGGGVVGDCAGFLAAIFMRGIPFIQVPTTVVAQVDASIGGKTGVNLRTGKNLVGCFHQPKAVLVDPALLETLEEREFRSGLFESLKCGVIRDKALFEFMAKNAGKIQDRGRKALERVIVDSVRVKANVVSADERESDLRRILNFGHTVGHALEAATNYSHLLHGEAVGWGMKAASDIAREVRFCSPQTDEMIQSAVGLYGPLPPVTVAAGEVIGLLKSDKKTVAGAVHFVLPQRIGKVAITGDVPVEVVHRAVERISNHA